MSKWKVRNIYTLWSNIQFHVQKESIWAKLRKLLNLNFRAKPNIHYSSIIEFFLKYFDVKHFILFCNFWTRCIILFQCGPQEKWPRPLKKHWRSDQVKQMQFSKTFNISVETFENWRLYSPKKVEVEKSCDWVMCTLGLLGSYLLTIWKNIDQELCIRYMVRYPKYNYGSYRIVRRQRWDNL